jgi:hypothetical protein
VTFVAFQLMHAPVLVLIVGNVIHANAVYMMLPLAADNDFMFYIPMI